MNSNSLCHKFFTNTPSLLASDHTPLSFFLWLSSLSPRLKRIKLLLIPLLSLTFVSNQSRILLGSISLICLCCSIPNASIPPLLPSSTSASMLFLTGFLVSTLSSHRSFTLLPDQFFLRTLTWLHYSLAWKPCAVSHSCPKSKLLLWPQPTFQASSLIILLCKHPRSRSWLLTGSACFALSFLSFFSSSKIYTCLQILFFLQGLCQVPFLSWRPS